MFGWNKILIKGFDVLSAMQRENFHSKGWSWYSFSIWLFLIQFSTQIDLESNGFFPNTCIKLKTIKTHKSNQLNPQITQFHINNSSKLQENKIYNRTLRSIFKNFNVSIFMDKFEYEKSCMACGWTNLTLCILTYLLGIKNVAISYATKLKNLDELDPFLFFPLFSFFLFWTIN